MALTARMPERPKRLKRLLRECAAAAHEEELRRALLPLAEAFERWRRGELESGELSGIIHDFDRGPARQIFGRYNTNHLDAPVAYAIAAGVLPRAAVPPEVLDDLARLIRYFETEAEG